MGSHRVPRSLSRSGDPERAGPRPASGPSGALESSDRGATEALVRAWVEEFVVGLSLCPFAAEPLAAGRVRFAVSAAETPENLAADLADELSRLDREPPEEIETTLLLAPRALARFEEFNAFLDVVDLLLDKLSLAGSVQVASFHPDYRFAGAPADDPANATNRAPVPILHLLREESVARAASTHPDPQGIPARNAARLRELGWAGIARLTPRGPRPASARGHSNG